MAADWGRIGGIASVVGGVAAVIALVPAFGIGLIGSGSTATVESDRQGSGAESTRSPASGATPTAQADCLDQTGQPVTCGAVGAGLVVETPSCTVDEALQALGVDPQLRQFDLVASVVSEECRLAPGALALAAGASAADIRAAAAGEAAARLSLCYATASGPEAPCSTTHVIEYVGPWRPDDGGDSGDALCDTDARRYANRTFDAPDEPLTVVLLRSNGEYRCGIAAVTPLTRSVWQIGGQALG